MDFNEKIGQGKCIYCTEVIGLPNLSTHMDTCWRKDSYEERMENLRLNDPIYLLKVEVAELRKKVEDLEIQNGELELRIDSLEEV